VVTAGGPKKEAIPSEMGICGSSPMNPVPILDMEVVKNEDPSTLPVHPPLAGIEGLKPGKETVVLVTGASAGVGGDVAQALIDAGYTVRASVGKVTSARVDFLRDMGCQLVAIPDMLADEGWAEAMAGCAGFVHVILHPAPHT